jgi:hypothetical protein
MAAGCYQLAWTRGRPGPDGGFFPSSWTLAEGPDSGRVVLADSGVWIGVSMWHRIGPDSLKVRLQSLGENSALVALHQRDDSVVGRALISNEFIDSIPPERITVRGRRVSCRVREACGLTLR